MKAFKQLILLLCKDPRRQSCLAVQAGIWLVPATWGMSNQAGTGRNSPLLGHTVGGAGEAGPGHAQVGHHKVCLVVLVCLGKLSFDSGWDCSAIPTSGCSQSLQQWLCRNNLQAADIDFSLHCQDSRIKFSGMRRKGVHSPDPWPSVLGKLSSFIYICWKRHLCSNVLT